jgi:bacteriorhodopsin
MIADKLIKRTIYFSLFAQILTTVISMDGFNYELNGKDKILKDILLLETFVQIIEAIFYVWVILSLKDLNIMAPRRYIDWMLTTPTMLLSTIIFMEYLKNNGEIRFKDFIYTHKKNIIKITMYNALMLLFGFLGETGRIDKNISIPVGFFFFYMSFKIIYEEYAKHSELGTKLFKFLVVCWALYGISAMSDIKTKNVAYNLLDIVSKNFYGLFIYYYILHINGKTELLGLM